MDANKANRRYLMTRVSSPPACGQETTNSSPLPRYTSQMLNRLPRSIFTTSRPTSQILYRSFRTTAINMGVTKQVLKQGNGSDKPKAGDNVSMVYTGWLEDTSKSDNKGMQ